MAISVEDRIRAVCDAGNLLHLALEFDHDVGKFKATYRNAVNADVNTVHDSDPVEAIRKAVSPLRMTKPPVSPVAVKPKNKGGKRPDGFHMSRVDRWFEKTGARSVVIARVGDRFQASVLMGDGKSHRVMYGDTPTEALSNACYGPKVSDGAPAPSKRKERNLDFV